MRHDYTKSMLAPAAYGVLRYWRARLPGRALAMLRAGRCEAVMAHFLLVSPRLATELRRVGAELYVWTVDDRRRIERLAALGVAGVITNDPRLFGSLRVRPATLASG